MSRHELTEDALKAATTPLDGPLRTPEQNLEVKVVLRSITGNFVLKYYDTYLAAVATVDGLEPYTRSGLHNFILEQIDEFSQNTSAITCGQIEVRVDEMEGGGLECLINIRANEVDWIYDSE